MELSLIFASTSDGVIGTKWFETIGGDGLDFSSTTENYGLMHSSTDKDHFKRVTQYTPFNGKNLMIIGRKTWDTLPPQMKTDKFRFYVILTRNNTTDDLAASHILNAPTPSNSPGDSLGKATFDSFCLEKRIKTQENHIFVNTFRQALEFYHKNTVTYYKCFVLGGSEIYRLAMETGLVTEIYWTKYQFCCEDNIEPEFYTNLVYFEPDLTGFRSERATHTMNESPVSLVYNKNKTETMSINVNTFIDFNFYVKQYQPFETQYINLITDIGYRGNEKTTRGTTTLSVTDRSIKVDLADGFPIMTIKKVFWRGIVEELLWMLRGETDANILREKNIHIWDGNSSREYLDSVGLTHLAEWDIGPGYGFQLRHYGADYAGCKADYRGKGIDQLAECINLIKTKPHDRRILIDLWNPSKTKEMALPPCHIKYQFTITKSKLSCHLYQRSWDTLLGWNTTTAALLTHILAHFCELGVGTLTHTICDAHIYKDHLDGFRQMIKRVPYKLPTLKIIGAIPHSADAYETKQFVLEDYQTHDKIQMEMVTGGK
jgi:dihydrofolate reductase/thymidylate synthase